LNDFRRTLTMKDDWGSAFLTAFLLAGPSILGVRALFRGPTRFAGRVVPRAMDRLAAAVWLAAFPLTIAIVFTRISYFPPRTLNEADYLSDVWAPGVLRVASIACLVIGGTIALLTARPEVKPKVKVKGKSKARYKNRKR
jgi:hypothetical protein